MTHRHTGNAARWNLAAVAILAFSLTGCLGCGGGRVLRAELERAETHRQPAWVGVYYLSKESAVDDVEIADLTNRQRSDEKLKGVDGVVLKEIQPVYPGDTVVLLKEDPDPSITCIVIVANLPEAGSCARQKLTMKKGQSLKVKVSIEENCLTIKKD